MAIAKEMEVDKSADPPAETNGKGKPTINAPIITKTSPKLVETYSTKIEWVKKVIPELKE